ncbi:hypothetical protein TKK_0010466 [Trichogramma kaykai]
MASGNSGKVRTRAQVEAFKQKLEALVRLEGPNEVMKKISEQPIQRIIDKLKQRRLSTVGDEETLRVRLWRARCRALPNSGQLDVPWDPETDEEPEQEQKSLNETIVQMKNQEMEVDGAQGGGAPPAPAGAVFTSQMMEELAEIVRREVNTAVAREIGKLSRGEARADTVGATVNLGLRGSPPRNSNSTPKVERPPRKVRRERATLGDFAAEGERFSSTPWESKMPLGLPLGYLGAEERRVRITGRKSHEQDAWSQGDFVTLEVGGETEEPPRIMQKEPDMRLCDRVSTLEERLGGEESSRGKRVTFTPGEDCTGGAITRNTNRRDPTSGGVSSDVARSAVCSGQTKPLVSGEYNSDEEIECLDSVCMATSETSTPDAQYGAESGQEEGAIVTTIAEIHEPRMQPCT